MKWTTKEYFRQFKDTDNKKFGLVKAGKLSRSKYISWRKTAMAQGNKYTHMVRSMAEAITKVNQDTAQQITDLMPDIYIENYNYFQHEIDTDTKGAYNFYLVNQNTIKNVLDENHRILPAPSIDIPKDMRWNEQKIRSAITQGIIKGDSIDKIADRLQTVENMSESQAKRIARTAVTGAENAGRIDSMHYMKSIGLNVKKKWVATMDHRTRDSHADLDGEIREVDEEFSNGMEEPGGIGPPEEVYNCRCTLEYVYED